MTIKTSTLLRQAKKHLCANSRSSYLGTTMICLAINRAVQEYHGEERRIARIKGNAAQRRIMRDLDGYTTVAGWAMGHFRKDIKSMRWPQDFNQLQAFRHRWLDHLITQYESKGD